MAEWVLDSAGFLIDPYSLSVILGDLGDLTRCAPIIKVVNMDYSSFRPTRSGQPGAFHESLGPRSGRLKVTTILFLVARSPTNSTYDALQVPRQNVLMPCHETVQQLPLVLGSLEVSM